MPSGPKHHLNRHQQEAREREEARKASAASKQEKEEEDALWEEDSKIANRKAQKAEESEQKRLARLQAKAERERLLEEEERDLAKGPPKKVTKRQVQKDMAALIRNFDMEKKLEKQNATVSLDERRRTVLEEMEKEKPAPAPLVPERDVAEDQPKSKKGKAALEEALGKLPSDARNIGRHARTAYKKFERDIMQSIKQENPGLRRTQLLNLIWQKWQKSPDNPFVQRAVARAQEDLDRKFYQSDSEEDEAPQEEA